MIPVLIDTRDVAAEFNLTREDVNAMVSSTIKSLTATFARNWDSVAKQSLGSTRQIYRSSIVVGEQGPFTGYVMLVNQLPNMIESGAAPFDMKVGFSQSSKRKSSKGGGWYLTVPFRMATPGSLGESEAFSSVMPQTVYAAVKSKQTQQTALGGTTQQGRGLSASEIPSDYQIPKSRAMIQAQDKVFEEYKHKHSIYEGLRKGSKTYQSATQGQYVTFRRVSSNSDANSWINKGLQARNLAERALAMTNIPVEVDRSVDKFLQSLGF
jgi:hypothetical protein